MRRRARLQAGALNLIYSIVMNKVADKHNVQQEEDGGWVSV